MNNVRRTSYRIILLLIFLNMASVLYAQVPSSNDSVSPSPTASTVNQPSDSQNTRTQPSPINTTPTPSNDKGLISPEMVTAIGSLWVWGVILIICILLFIFRRELRGLVRKAEQAETILIGAPGGVNLQIGKPLETDRKAEPSPTEEKAAPPPQQKEILELKGKRESERPSVEKTIEDLRNDLEEAFSTNDESKIQSAYEALRAATTAARDMVVNEAVYLYHKFRHGDTSAIAKLQKLTEQESAASVTYYYLGICYEHAGEIDQALEAYRHSVERTEDKIAKAYRVVVLATCLLRAGKKSDAYSVVSSEISKTKETEILPILYGGLADLYKKSASPLYQAFALEKALEYEPNNTSLIFDLAYAYGEAELQSLSILHYKRLLRFDNKHSIALNNLGVEYENQQMPILSVSSYKKASELNNTLALANLAYRLMNAGFAPEASELLDKAKEQQVVHPNVGSALAGLHEKQEGEKEKEKTLIEGAIKQQQFLRAFSEMYFQNLDTKDEIIAGAWQLEDGTEVQVTQDKSIVIANWVVIGKKHQFTGAVTNRTIRLTKKKMEYSWYNNTEIDFKNEYEGYAYLSEDNENLHIMYMSSGTPIFVTMIKKDDSESNSTSGS